MAGTSLLALIDDIAFALDDIAALTKVAAKKTSGVLGDDLALNAQQVSGVSAHREIPVVLAVAKGSAINKLILVPSALAISQLAPWAIVPLLMLGGGFLCFEGFEKVFEKIFKKNGATDIHTQKHFITESQSPLEFEKEKIKGAVRTDFILSAEIIVITLGTVAQKTLPQQASVLTGISILMTLGVYGLVAGIVKIDDLGLYFSNQVGSLKQRLGRFLLSFAPLLMKFLGIAGTIAMFLVGGGIVSHNIPSFHHQVENMGPVLGSGIDFIIGVAVGGLVFFIFTALKKLKKTS
jgi:predicted DNA repair protein MutK